MGPLSELRVIEIGGIGPGPMCGMILSDLGARVLRIQRSSRGGAGHSIPPKFDLLLRGRRQLALDLKRPAAVDLLLDLIGTADALVEPFRPGVMERLGLGPEECAARNSRLVYGRLTGWGQTGPLSGTAGHDINYIALSGALHCIGRNGAPPTPPLNLVGDYAGALYMALALLAAVLEARSSGKGQVIDVAMAECAAHLMTVFHGLIASNQWSTERGTNLLDSGAYFYDVYECKDGRWLSIGCLEPKFFEQMVSLIGVDRTLLPPRAEPDRWPEGRAVLARHFKTRTCDDWCAVLEGSDACHAPVLTPEEATRHPHFVNRRAFVDIAGIVQPAPVPKFSRTRPGLPEPPSEDGGAGYRDALLHWGMSPEHIESWEAAGAFG